MAYSISVPYIGAQPIANTETTAKHPLGTIVRAVDPTYGEGEFIYLLGVASTVVGSVVVYNDAGYQTTLAPAGSNLAEPIAIAMSANVASQYGWYQIGGRAIAKKTSGLAIASNAAVGVKTAGLISATGTGKEVQGALSIAKCTAATTCSLIINRPHMQGRIT